MSDRWPKESLDKVYFCQSVLEESVHDAQGIVTTLLPQEPSIVIDTYVSITMFACHSLASFPTCAITLWRPLEFENFRKKTPKCTWLCTGISPVCSTDPIKSQKTWQVFCTGKKNFARGVRAFCEWLCKWRTFRPPWPTLPGLGRQPLGGSISLKLLLETRLQSESFDTLDDLLGFWVKKLWCKLVKIFWLIC